MSHRRRRAQSGRAILETSLVLSAFLFLVLAVADVAQFLFVHASLAHRVRSAARMAIEAGPRQPEAIRRWVTEAGFHLQPENVEIAELDAGSQNHRLEVRIVNYRYDAISPVIAAFRKGKPIVASMPLGVNQ